ncbi:MAG: cytosine permease [Fibrobacterales bacterium]|nr:cytosine permease [Fibrobacterales bacterium]MBP5187951.1 cytosine permease [Fibrobacterales bacterium]
MEKRTGLSTNAVIWFGVAVSVSEIEAGIEIGAGAAPGSLWAPLVLGHVVGGIFLFFVGLVGARVRVNAMETTAAVYGKGGSRFFASLNLLQLVAWIAVLNAQGASVLAGLDLPVSFPLTCALLAALIALWVFAGLRRFAKVAAVVMAVLAVLLAALTARLFGVGASSAAAAPAPAHALGFWNVFEISMALPLSWLPVISDYTKDVEKPVRATAVSAIAYSLASFWMYFIGLEIAGAGADNDIAKAILLAGFGIPGIVVVVLSTVTTNFLAANSAGESAKAIVPGLNPKTAGVAASAAAAALAISGIMDHYIDFLYLVASVFAPMAAVLLVSHYSAPRPKGEDGASPATGRASRIWNLSAWLAGFVVYQAAVRLDSVFLGPTLASVLVAAAISYIWVLKNKFQST